MARLPQPAPASSRAGLAVIVQRGARAGRAQTWHEVFASRAAHTRACLGLHGARRPCQQDPNSSPPSRKAGQSVRRIEGYCPRGNWEPSWRLDLPLRFLRCRKARAQHPCAWLFLWGRSTAQAVIASRPGVSLPIWPTSAEWHHSWRQLMLSCTHAWLGCAARRSIHCKPSSCFPTNAGRSLT